MIKVWLSLDKEATGLCLEKDHGLAEKKFLDKHRCLGLNEDHRHTIINTWFTVVILKETTLTCGRK